MLLNLLTSGSENATTSGNGWLFWVICGGLLVAMIVMNWLNNKKRKAQIEAEKEKRNAIQPGYKIVTIGGIVGYVVEVNEDNTFVLKTGTEENPSYMTFDKVAIYTSEDPNAQTEEVLEDPIEEGVEFGDEVDAPIEENLEETAESSTETEDVVETAKVEAETEEKAE